MKHSVLLFLLSGLLVFGIGTTFGADKKDFEKIVDFSVSIENLDEVFEERIPFDRDKLVILEGTLKSVTILEKEADRFLASAELVKGIWKTLDEIQVNRCTLIFSGPDFSGRISGRISDDPGIAGLNDHVLVVGKPGTTGSVDGQPVQVVYVQFIRTL